MRRRQLIAVLMLGLMSLLAWWLWPHQRQVEPPAPPPPPFTAPAGAQLRSTQGAQIPRAHITTALARPCVRGRVVNAVTNAGVPSAIVSLVTPRGIDQVQTDEGGAFEFKVDGGGAVALAGVAALGGAYFPYSPSWGHFPIELNLLPGTCVSDLVLSLVPRVEYRGFVLGPDDEPVPGASVTIGTEEEAPAAPVLSGPDGSFVFSAQDGAVVVARHPNFAPGSAVVDFKVGVTRELIIRLPPRVADGGVERATLEGIVLDERDAGLPGAQVRALQDFVDREPRLESAMDTDAEGRFSFVVDGPGPWTVFARARGVLLTPVTTHGEPVELRVVAGAELRGAVVDGAGRAVQSFTVMISYRVGPLRLEGEDARHVVSADGRFAFKGLAPGRVLVAIAALGYASSEPSDVELAAPRPAEVNATLREGAKVTGQLIDRQSRAPLEGARVSLEGHEDSTLMAMPSARSDADGGFLLTGLTPGRRSLFIAAAQHHARLISVEAREGETTGPLLIDLGAIEKGEEPRLELVGIGAVLEARGDALVLKQVLPGGGAAEAGLVAGDGIVSIEGEAAAALGFGGGIERIRGPEGTYVRLEVRRLDGTVSTVVAPRRRLER